MSEIQSKAIDVFNKLDKDKRIDSINQMIRNILNTIKDDNVALNTIDKFTKPKYDIDKKENTYEEFENSSINNYLYSSIKIKALEKYVKDIFLILSGYLDETIIHTEFEIQSQKVKEWYEEKKKYIENIINKTSMEFINKFLSLNKDDAIKDNFFGNNDKRNVTIENDLNYFLNDIESELYKEEHSLISYKSNLLKEFKKNPTYEKLNFGDNNLIKIPFIGLEILYRTHRSILTEEEENKLWNHEKEQKYKDIIMTYINAIYGAYNLFQKIGYYKRIGSGANSIGNRKRKNTIGNQRYIRLSRQYHRLGLLQYEFTGITGWTKEIKLLGGNNVRRVILMHPSFVFDKDYRDFMYKCYQFNELKFHTLQEIINDIDSLKNKNDEMSQVWDKVSTTLINLNSKYKSPGGYYSEFGNI